MIKKILISILFILTGTQSVHSQIFTRITETDTTLPVIVSVSPDSGFQGHNLNISIFFQNVLLTEGNSINRIWISNNGSTVNAHHFSIKGLTSLIAEFSMPVKADTGFWDLSVETTMEGIIKEENRIKIYPMPPEISVYPSNIQIQLSQSDSVDISFSVSNTSNSDLIWSARISPVLSESSNSEIMNNSHVGHFIQAQTSLGNLTYGVNLYRNEFVKFNIDNPQNIETITSNIGDCYAGDFDGAGNFYAIDAENNQLITIDTLNGQITTIRTMLLVDGHIWTGLTFDYKTGAMYASSTDYSISLLYHVNVSDGTTTLIDTVSSTRSIIDIATDNRGNLFAHDIYNDAIFSLDKTTAEATLIGYTDFNANYIQGMDFNPQTGILYLAAFNGDYFKGEFREVDLSTGHADLIGPIGFGYDVEIGAFGIPNINTAFIRLLEPSSGIIKSGGIQNLVIRLYGLIEESKNTSWQVNVEITSNDPFNPRINMPVVLDVVTGIQDEKIMPDKFDISQNYPNPFNLSTIIKFQLSVKTLLRLNIYDVMGRNICTLVNKIINPGFHSIHWDGCNDDGIPVPSGVYFYKIKTENVNKLNKMILVK
jgi:hypothetical protein